MNVLLERHGASALRVLTQGGAASLQARGVDVVKGSVTSPADVAKALTGIQRVYHLAGLVSRKPDDGHKMFDVHVNGTRVLCEGAVAAKVGRIVLASTSGTIAVSKQPDEHLDEESPAPLDLIARWPYYASKLYQEEAAKRFCADKVELVTVNPSLLLGPGDERLSSTRDVLSFLAREIPICPKGGLNFVDARDVAAVLPVAMERGRAGERYLLGGTNWTFAEYFGRLSRMTKVPAPTLKLGGKWPLLATRLQAAVYDKLGRKPPIEPAGVEMADHFWYFDSAKAKRELGFAPREAAETLFDTVSYLRRHVLGRETALGA
jgi:dihydroflavonol-4-reductase